MLFDPGDDDVLDVQAAAKLAGRTAETIRRWVWSERLPAVRRGRKLLVHRVDVLRLINGPQVELDDLGDWHRRAVEQARAMRRPGGEAASAADLVLADRQDRDEEQGTGAGR